jgi:hypothetical protein
MKNIASKIMNGVKYIALTTAIGLASVAGAQGVSTTTPGTPTTGLGGVLTLNASLLVLAISLIAIGLMLLLGSNKYGL